jgi:hypothetical protein
MKELIGTSTNQYLVIADKPVVMTEFIFVTSEPSYKPDGGGGICRVRENEQFRVSIQPSELLKLSKWFSEAYQSAEELAKRITIESELTK